MVYARISIRPAFQKSPSGGMSKEDPGAAFCCVLLTLFGSTASSTTVNALIVMRQYMESLFVTLSYLLYHQFCEKKNITIMLVLQRYFGPENYSRAFDYLANHMWLFKN